MSVISQVIPHQAFEIIHDKLGILIRDEMDNQYALTGDPYLECDVWKERDIRFNDSELARPNINIILERGGYNDLVQTNRSQEAEYRYVLEVEMNAKGFGGVTGDTIAMIRVQRVMGIIRAIIMSPKYVTLGLAKPYIQHRRVDSFMFGKPVRQDSSHTIMGRMVVVVKPVEGVDYITPVLAQGGDTVAKLGLTERGFLYSSISDTRIFDFSFGYTFE